MLHSLDKEAAVRWAPAPEPWPHTCPQAGPELPLFSTLCGCRAPLCTEEARMGLLLASAPVACVFTAPHRGWEGAGDPQGKQVYLGLDGGQQRSSGAGCS